MLAHTAPTPKGHLLMSGLYMCIMCVSLCCTIHWNLSQCLPGERWIIHISPVQHAPFTRTLSQEPSHEETTQAMVDPDMCVNLLPAVQSSPETNLWQWRRWSAWWKAVAGSAHCRRKPPHPSPSEHHWASAFHSQTPPKQMKEPLDKNMRPSFSFYSLTGQRCEFSRDCGRDKNI